MDSTLPPVHKPLVRKRVESVDLLRGLIMVIMALDHSRDFFHAATINGLDPTDIQQTSPAFFFTRWITHFCAPVFVFLSGVSIFFVSLRKSKSELSRFLITRGFWLIIMEITIVHIGWSLDFNYYFTMLQVIWAIGICMVILGLLIYLPLNAILAIGLIIVFGHNLLDPLDKELSAGNEGILYALLHVQRPIFLDDLHMIVIGYPFLPWLGLMACGVAFGSIYKPGIAHAQRRKFLLYTGITLSLLFILLRYLNHYGDPSPWTERNSIVFTIMSFLNTTKYPPSLLYMLMTIGPAMIFLSLFENYRTWLTEKLVVIGRVPFFYYILHIYLIHAIMILLFMLSGNEFSDLVHDGRIGGLIPGFGYPLWQVYLLWLLVVVVLYFPCRWYNRYKGTHTHWWLSYL